MRNVQLDLREYSDASNETRTIVSATLMLIGVNSRLSEKNAPIE